MKKIIFILPIFVFISSLGMAQSKNDLKGPKAKNYKHWKHDDSSSALLFTAEEETKKGPAAKNQKVWRNNPATIQSAQAVDLSSTPRLKGPKAKNTPPTERYTTIENTTAKVEE